MTLAALSIQLINGLASASALFLVSVGLSLIFGVTRIVNFAHGSLYMLGAYLAYTLIGTFGGGGFSYWSAVVTAALAVAMIGVAIEIVLLRRIYHAPELLQLIATFGVVLIVEDAVLWLWGPQDLLGPRAPGLKGALIVAGGAVPQYDLLLIALGPLVLALLWYLLRRTRWGTLLRAATEDREMAAALGVNQAWLFSTVFFLGSFLAALAGALQLPREPANLGMDLAVIADVFVVTVIGGLGSVPGAFLAALLISVVKALLIGLGDITLGSATFALSKLTLVAEFVVMAVVLVVRPWGLLGRSRAVAGLSEERELLKPPTAGFWVAMLIVLLSLALLPVVADSYSVVLTTDILLFGLFAASLNLLMGPGGMASFGHAAYFGLGAYAAGLLTKLALPMGFALGLAPFAAAVGALVFGWFCVRLSGVYLAMLTLAFAQITWSVVFQWDAVTGGSNGLVGVWPAAWLADKRLYYYFTLAIVSVVLVFLWRSIFSPFGYALRGTRDSPLRAEAIGIDVRAFRVAAFVIAGFVAGIAGALYAFSKGSIAPDVMAIPRSVDGLVMVLLGGLNSLVGPLLGAALFTTLQDTVARHTDFWRALLGGVILLLVVAFPQGIAGAAKRPQRPS